MSGRGACLRTGEGNFRTHDEACANRERNTGWHVLERGIRKSKCLSCEEEDAINSAVHMCRKRERISSTCAAVIPPLCLSSLVSFYLQYVPPPFQTERVCDHAELLPRIVCLQTVLNRASVRCPNSQDEFHCHTLNCLASCSQASAVVGNPNGPTSGVLFTASTTIQRHSYTVVAATP